MSTKSTAFEMRRDSAGILASAGARGITRALTALRRYIRRKVRIERPDGRFDGGGRWYPTKAENCDGFTVGTRSPSVSWPLSYLFAARSLAHCEALDNADHEVVLALRRVGIDGSWASDAAAVGREVAKSARKWIAKHQPRHEKGAA